jgi:hypothetical protein
MSKYKSIIIIYFLLLPKLVICQDNNVIPYNSGIIYGNSHVFTLKAPEGWVLDNQSGVSQGLHAVFYPKGQTWRNSPIVAYTNTRVKDNIVNSIEDQVKFTIKDFKENGNPYYEGKHITDIKLKDN